MIRFGSSSSIVLAGRPVTHFAMKRPHTLAFQAFAVCMLLAFGSTLSTLAAPAAARAASAPNFLLIMADDASYHELPLYGGKNIRTPNIDRLAAEGLVMRQAYVTIAMCVPCRAELHTGLYPMRNGVRWNHVGASPGTRSAPHYLGERGYRVGLAGKVHTTPKTVFPWEMVEGFERNCVAATAGSDCAGIKEFMGRNPAQPFYLVVALVSPHAPWTVGDRSRFDPAKIAIPPYLPDTPETRSDLVAYYAEYEDMDRQVGDILRTLEETGRAGDTLVLFSSEQGGQWPGAKWTNWDAGLHTAMVARWPGRVAPGTSTEALVQYVDVLPTLLEAAGGDPRAVPFDGRSFLPVLLGRTQRHRDVAFAMHNNLPEGPAYPIRAALDGRYHYIRNLQPDRLYIEKHVMGRTEHNKYWPSWVWQSETDPHAYAIVQRYMRRPAEELYDNAADPFQLRNLAADPAHAETKRRLSSALDQWMREQGDPGAEVDTVPYRQKHIATVQASLPPEPAAKKKAKKKKD